MERQWAPRGNALPEPSVPTAPPAPTEEDWCASAQKRVEEGSDGLWFRAGPPVDDSCRSLWFSVRFNPCVSCGAIFMLFSVVCFCMFFTTGNYCMKVEQESRNNATVSVLAESECYVPGKEFRHWQKWVTNHFTWLYIVTQDVWIIFIFGICFTKYGKLKLGRDEDVPEFNFVEWFSMIFCCGVSTGLFFFGVSEPIWHYEPCGMGKAGTNGTCIGDADYANRWSTLPANERAQESMNMTFYQWGVHGWVPYVVAGLLLGLLHFRKGLPMTIKTCFYPLVGDRIYGFWGDLVDTISVVATTYGVCVSLGIGVSQINAGLKRLKGGENWMGLAYFGANNSAAWLDADSESTYKGIWDNAPGAWKTSNPFYANGEVNVPVAAQIAQQVKDNDLQIFLIWLITIVATFSVSLGLKRGIKAFSLIAWTVGMMLCWIIFVLDDSWYIANLFVQSLGHYIWALPKLGFYTGAFDQPEHSGPDGRQETSSYMDDWTIWYWGWWIAWCPFVGVFLARISKGRTVREFVGTVMVIAVSYNFLWMTIWGGAALKMEMAADKYGVDTCTRKNVCREVSTGRDRFGGQAEYFCSMLTRLSCMGGSDMLFDLVMQYGSIGPFLSVMSIIAITMYFVTSSDSGSMVDDMLTANGIPEPPLVQRIWWACTEGLAATGLMYAGRYLDPSNAFSSLHAMRALSLVVGLPYTFLLCLMCWALWRLFQYEFGELRWEQGFPSGVLDFGVTLYSASPSSGRCFNGRLGRLDCGRLLEILKLTFCPFLGLFPCMKALDAKSSEGPDARWSATKAVVFGGVLFYAGWLLIFIDAGARFEESPTASLGKWNNSTARDFWIMEDISTRFGFFSRYTNEWRSGQVLTESGQMVHGETQGMGSRVGSSMQLMSVGWFLYLVFATVVAATRSQVRQLRRIPGSFIEDCMAAVLLYPTTLYQIREALQDHDSKGAQPDGDEWPTE